MGRNMFGGKACESARAAMTSDPTPYGELNSVLHELLSNIRVALGESLAGVYLQGSFALGDFDGDSDVDFIVVTRDELTEPQVAALQTVHARVSALESEWAKHLEGRTSPWRHSATFVSAGRRSGISITAVGRSCDRITATRSSLGGSCASTGSRCPDQIP